MRDAAMCVIRLTMSCHRSALDFLISPILIRGCVPIVSRERLLSPGAFNRSFLGDHLQWLTLRLRTLARLFGGTFGRGAR